MSAFVDTPVPVGWRVGYFNYAHLDGKENVRGWMRGCWGIFAHGYETSGGDFELSSLTHLATGYRFSLFTEARDAAEAADLADLVCDWTELTVEAGRRSAKERLRVATYNDLKPREASIEHLKRKVDGGKVADHNIVMACRGCNSRRQNTPVLLHLGAMRSEAARLP